MPRKSQKGFPPFLVNDHCFVVIPIHIDGGGYVPLVYALAEPQHLGPREDAEVIMDIYTAVQLQAELDAGVYLPAWSWKEVERLDELGPEGRRREMKLQSVRALLRLEKDLIKAGAR